MIMLDSELKISIITPNYNYAPYIVKTIKSVIDQDYLNWEHIIVDDGSTDNSEEVIRNYANQYPNKIKLIVQSNVGQTRALNVALRNVTGDIIGWINSDDYYCNNVFSKISNYFNTHRGLDAVYGHIRIIDDQDNFIRVNKYLKFDYASGVFNDFGKIIPSNAIFWKRILTDQVGIFDESLTFTMDSEYWSRLLFKRNIDNINTVIAAFRWHPASKTIRSHDVKSQEYLIARAEKNLIAQRAYSKLSISQFIPYKYSYFMYIYYRLKRLALRGIMGEYFI
jgi:glycosyltransferase involved in cell wall biosynthesis